MSGPVRAVIFDWGGTLTPWHTVDLARQWHVFAEHFHAEAPELVPDLAGRIHAVESQIWSQGRVTGHASARLEDILTQAGVVVSHPRHASALTAYHDFWEPHTFTDPQVRPLWEGLRESGIRVGVLSNTIWSREHHRAIFERDGVVELIDADVYSSETPWMKPAPEIFQAAASAISVDVADCVYVGDRSYEDVHGPQAVGMRAIWVPHSEIPLDQQVSHRATPDGVAHQLLDVLDIVRGWRA